MQISDNFPKDFRMLLKIPENVPTNFEHFRSLNKGDIFGVL